MLSNLPKSLPSAVRSLRSAHPTFGVQLSAAEAQALMVIVEAVLPPGYPSPLAAHAAPPARHATRTPNSSPSNVVAIA